MLILFNCEVKVLVKDCEVIEDKAVNQTSLYMEMVRKIIFLDILDYSMVLEVF